MQGGKETYGVEDLNQEASSAAQNTACVQVEASAQISELKSDGKHVSRKAFSGMTWLALFKGISQAFSWSITIVVARLLTPDDYGLMEMATVITGYAAIFNELGLGAAIIQRRHVSHSQLSSVYWFTIAFSTVLGGLCFAVAYPTAWIFQEPRVIPLTQGVSVLFVLSGATIVPLSLMQREMRFRETGFQEMLSVMVSSCAMLGMALGGFGAWTLLGGHIVRNATRATLAHKYTKWKPLLTFSVQDVKSYLRFGATVALSSSLSYVYAKSDRFFAGRSGTVAFLGYYTLALDLAKMPTQKIVTLVKQVSFSAFSHLQSDLPEFRKFYKKSLRIISTIVFPLFIGSAIVCEDLVHVVLNPKWYGIIDVFRYLCLAQILVAINAINGMVHTTRGKPKYTLMFNLIMVAVVPVSFYFAAKGNLITMVIPWFTTYAAVAISWIVLTMKELRISVGEYLRCLSVPSISSILMALSILFLDYMMTFFQAEAGALTRLILRVVTGGGAYISVTLLLDREIFVELKRLANGRFSRGKRSS